MSVPSNKKMNSHFNTSNHRFDNRQFEEEAFNMTIQDLKKQLEEKKKAKIEIESPLLSPKKKRKHPEYLLEISEQIKKNEESRMKEREEKMKPAISPEMNGYPNLPVITCQEKRDKKIAQIQAFKIGLDMQLQEKHYIKKKAAEEKAEIEKSVIEMAHQKYKSMDHLNNLKKQKEKELLDSFWKKGELTKKLKDLAENPHKTRRNDWFDHNLIDTVMKSTNQSYLVRPSRTKEKGEKKEYLKKIERILSSEKYKKIAHSTPRNSKFYVTN